MILFILVDPTLFNETENYSEILVEIAWLRNYGDLRIKLEINYLTILCVFEFKGFHNEGGGQPRSQGFRVRTRGETRKPWCGPVNFAF
jgi:hypothetical protein